MTSTPTLFDYVADPLPVRSTDLPHGPLCAWPECANQRRPRRSDPFCTMHRTRLDRDVPLWLPKLRGRGWSICYVAGCSRPAHSEGLCHGHRHRKARGAAIDDAPLRESRRGSVEDRFWRYVTPSDGCWEWQGRLDCHGYAWISRGGRGAKRDAAHRVSYELHIGPIPEGLHIDHLCRNPRCVNPSHLEPVTQAENNRRALPFKKPQPKPTHCPQGHAYAGDNLYVRPNGVYNCRACNREQVRLYRERVRAS
jgi:hypothetical protein